MADLSDVLNQLTAQVAAIVYPNGTSQPSVCGIQVKIYPGWPVPNVLESDLKVGRAHISLYPLATERKTTRYIGRDWTPLVAPVHSVTMMVSGATVTLSGTISRQNLLINVNGVSHVYAMQPSDTLTSAATGLSALIPGSSSVGPVITLSGAHSIIARVGGFGAAIKETKRQEKQFQITVWAPTPTARDAASSPIDSHLSDATGIALPDGSYGIIRYSHSIQTDAQEKSGLYRRDLIYTVDYATTQTQQQAEAIAPVLNITNALSGLPEITVNP
ncbi:hypothetical protein A9978_18985 [Pseudomonas sp. UMC65]|uniref:hypothetical protein n=1 Tax=Pseudomonas sp. UMC65 TaxID=1862323 RepID=UPI001600E1F0|nr:hypothetical protein [Pseudomonas sp. UMC65]MBB1614525.1 hypothetical protein [Pseudomonas sp. UMC65]